MQRPGDPRALQRLARAELGAQRHQPRHLGLGDLDLLAAEVGERDVLDDIILGHDGQILAHGDGLPISDLGQRAAHSKKAARSTTATGRAKVFAEAQMAVTAPHRRPGALRPGRRLRLRHAATPASRWFAAAQIARLNPDRDFDICLCAPGEDLAPVPGLADLGVRLCRIDDRTASSRSSGSTPGAPRPPTSASRCPRPSPATTARLLYLDFGRLPPGRRLRRRSSTPTSAPHPVAAVRDNDAVAHARPAARSSSASSASPSAPYFNCGVLLIDVPGLRQPARARALPRHSAAPTPRR